MIIIYLQYLALSNLAIHNHDIRTEFLLYCHLIRKQKCNVYLNRISCMVTEHRMNVMCFRANYTANLRPKCKVIAVIVAYAWQMATQALATQATLANRYPRCQQTKKEKFPPNFFCFVFQLAIAQRHWLQNSHRQYHGHWLWVGRAYSCSKIINDILNVLATIA